MEFSMRVDRMMAAALLVVTTLAAGVSWPTMGPAAAATTDPCSGLEATNVASAFGVKKIALMTRGKNEFAQSCFFSTQGQFGPCLSGLTAFVTTERYRNKAAAADAFAAYATDAQALPNGDPPQGTALTTGTLPGIGSNAYYTNRRGGMVVTLVGKLIRGFGGGLIVPSTLACDAAALRSVNRDGLVKLATKIAPAPKTPATSPPSAVKSGLIDVCTSVTPAEASIALGGTYSEGKTPKSVSSWKPDEDIKGYGVCQIPLATGDGLLDISVWRYATADAAKQAFQQSADGQKKDGVPGQTLTGVGDAAAFYPAHPASDGKGVVNPRFDAVVGPVLIIVQDARSDHTSPDGRTVADQTGESERLAKLAATALSRLQ